jgi:glycosyltransferase involved in cell wall biosynthesis
VRICVVSLACRVHGIGGVQDHTTELSRALAARGHEVEVLSSAHPEGVAGERWEGVRWLYAETPPSWFGHPAWLEASVAAYRRASAAGRFDVVHGQGSGALGLVLAGVGRETPIVEMFHGNYLGLVKASALRARGAGAVRPVLREARSVASLTRRHLAHANWRCFRGGEAIVPSRQQLRDTCRSHLLDPRRVHVVPNGVDTSVFRPRDAAALRARLGLGDGFLFVSVGRLQREKGMHHAIDGLADVRADGADARLVLVGDGEERAGLEALARARGVDAHVVFAGAQPRDRVAEHLAAADAFLFPTERDEAAPLVLPQALASGLPAIASSRGGIPEVIDRPGENGLLVRPGSRESLTAAMHAVLGDAGLRSRLAAGALARAREEYTLEGMVDRTLAVYETAQARFEASRHARRRLWPFARTALDVLAVPPQRGRP